MNKGDKEVRPQISKITSIASTFLIILAVTCPTVAFENRPYCYNPGGVMLNTFNDSSLWNAFPKRFSLVRSLYPTNFPAALTSHCQNLTTPFTYPDDLDEALRQDPDVLALVEISEQMTHRVIDLNVSVSALKRAYENKNESEIIFLLGYSDAEIKDLHYQLDKRRLAVLEKFPVLGELMKENQQSRCGYSPSAYACESNRFFDNFSTYSNNSLRPVTCRYGPYVAALLVCTLAGPVWYWPCAYVALCSFCSGGWVDQVCF